MSKSKEEYSISNLYCDEASDEVVSQDSDVTFDHVLYADSDSRPDEESSIVSAFNSEIDQVLDSDMIQRFINNSGVASDRLEAVNWMLKVHGFYHFRPETAYLSVNYLDHFLLSRTLQKGKGWHFQLLSVACLSLAAKMEEISVPLLLDLQMKEPKFLFKPKTIQRMELMVMTILKWRLRKITPFDFLHYFVHKLSCFGLIHFQHYNHVISQSSDIIVLTCQVKEFLDYPPSAIAAAAVLCATDQYPDERIVVCLHQRVSRVSPVDSHGFSSMLVSFHMRKCFFVRGSDKNESSIRPSVVADNTRTAKEFCSIKRRKLLYMFRYLTH